MRRTTKASAVVVLAMCAGATTWCVSRVRVDHVGATNAANVERSATSRAPAVNVGATAAAPSSAQRMPGDVREYELTITSDVSFAGGKDGALRSLPRVVTQGRLVDMTVQITSTGPVSLLTLASSDASSNPFLARGIIVERDPHGAIARARLPLGVTSAGAAALRSIVDAINTTSPPSSDANTWTGEEPTSLGARVARYERGKETGGFVKHVERMNPSSLQPALRADDRGELQGAFDAQSALVRLRGKDTVTTRFANGAALGTLTSDVDLTWVNGRKDMAAAIAVSASLDASFAPWQSLDAPLPQTVEEQNAALARIAGGRTMSDVHALILLADKDDPAARHEIGETLWAFLRLHPESTAEIGRVVASRRPDQGAARLLASSLVASATPEAQRAVASVVKAWRSDPSSAGPLLAGLGMAPSPSRETEAFLTSVWSDASSDRDLAHASVVALGNVAGRVRDADPARADVIASDIAESLRAKVDPSDATTELAALGNARSDRAAEVAPPFLKSDDPAVRRMAVFALARSGIDSARALVEDAAKNDPDDSVRREATNALGS